MKKTGLKLGAALLALLMLAGCAAPAAAPGQPEKSSPGAVEMTDVGTPRAETLIMDSTAGLIADPYLVNPYMPGAISGGSGLNQFLYEPLWDINNQTGEQFPELAENFPEPLDDSNTRFKVKLKEGLKWSDGVEITTEDVVFTSEMLLNNEALTAHGWFKNYIKKMTAIDKYNFEIETTSPQPKLTHILGVVVSNNQFKVVPKHIWEKEDPATFKNSDPVGSGPYLLKDRDPQGAWMLYEKREDWADTPVGRNAGEPKPKYVLIKYFGSEEKRVMAALNNEVDLMTEVSPESWDILRKKNPNMIAWYQDFPYATFDDPCAKGVLFNCAKAPFDNPNVRWALTLAIDVQSAALSAYNGIVRLSPLQTPPVSLLQEIYSKPMLDWLRNFELSDGYKPFDDQQAQKLVENLQKQGTENLPSGDDVTDVFGIGWWKYDTAQAEKMLLAEGFTKKDGKWYTPDGELWTIVIATPTDYALFQMRICYAIANSWKKFGIDAQVKQMDFATLSNVGSMGEFDVWSSDNFSGAVADTSIDMSGWHKDLISPIGERDGGYNARWKSDTVSELLDKAYTLEPDGEEIKEVITEINKEFVREMPALSMFGGTKLIPFNTTYWTNFPTSENDVYPPWFWHCIFKYTLTQIKPVAN